MFVFLLALICILLYRILSSMMTRKSGSEDPPMLVGYRPIVGHLFLLLCSTAQIWKNIKRVSKVAEKQASVVQIVIMNTVIYLVSDPEAALAVANNAETKHYTYSFFKRWLGEGLLTSSVGVWKRHRKLMNPSFNLRVLYSFLGIFNEQSKKLQRNFENEMKNGPVNVLPLIKASSLESICMSSIGIDPDDREFNEEYMLAVDTMLVTITERIRKVWLHNDFIYSLSSLSKQEDNIMKVLTNMTDKILIKKRASLKRRSTEETKESENLGTKFKALLDLLLELSEEDLLTDKEIREELSTAVFGGYDTTSLTLTYVLMNLGTYQDVQEKLYQEIINVFGNTARDVDSNDLSKLLYTEAVIKETLRLYPPGPIMFRELDKDIQIKDYRLRAGYGCGINIYGLNRHSVWGEDAEQFRPERWIEPGGVPDMHHAFASFGVGRRSCIGKVYAMLSMKTTLVHILRRFRIYADITKMELKIEVVLTPVKPCHITLEKR